MRRTTPIGRALTIPVALGLFGLAWAALSEVDVVATATGRLIPSGHVKRVQPSEDGIVSRILVGEGERVFAGQPVLLLDATEVEADLRRLEVELDNARMGRLRLIAALEGREDADLVPASGSGETRAFTQRAYLRTLVQQYRAEQARGEGESKLARSELASAQARHRMLHDVLELLEERHDAAEQLVRQGVMPRLRFLELREELLRTRQDHAEETQAIARARARISSVDQQHRHLQAEFRNGLRREQLGLEERIAVLEQELVKTRRRRERMTLRAPSTVRCRKCRCSPRAASWPPDSR